MIIILLEVLNAQPLPQIGGHCLETRWSRAHNVATYAFMWPGVMK